MGGLTRRFDIAEPGIGVLAEAFPLETVQAILKATGREGKRKRLAGVILLSDGAQRAYAPRDVPPQTPARRLADLGYPLYTFTFGQSRGLGQARRFCQS